MINKNGIPNIDLTGFQNQFNLNLGNNQDVIKKPSKEKKTDKKEQKVNKEFDIKKIPAPHIIKEKLDDYIVGQEKAKKTISVTVYNHYKRTKLASSKGC